MIYDITIFIEKRINIMDSMDSQFQYDVAFSFAGEQRNYVEKVKESLKEYYISVFYDNDNNVDLWGKNLYRYLDDLYSKKARYCVVFISKEYAKRPWTIHESQSVQERQFLQYDSKEFQEYILPVRFDDTQIPGIRGTTGYLDAAKLTPQQLAQAIAQKVKPEQYDASCEITISTLYEYLVNTIRDILEDDLSFSYNKSNSNLDIKLNLEVQRNLMTIHNFEKYIHVYIRERSLGENPAMVIFMNPSKNFPPIKLLNFSVFFGQFVEREVDFTNFKYIMKEGIKKILEV